MKAPTKNNGFTIVELLIVVVVIAILAAITIVSFNGIQARAQDTKRISDINSISKVLAMYKVDYGVYPTHDTHGIGSWEVSSQGYEFMPYIKQYGFGGGVPVDPINNANVSDGFNVPSPRQYAYVYRLYAAGSNNCDVNRGDYYVLGVITMKSTGGAMYGAPNPNFFCAGGYSWGNSNELNYVRGEFTK